jgi:hypothetical protein
LQYTSVFNVLSRQKKIFYLKSHRSPLHKARITKGYMVHTKEHKKGSHYPERDGEELPRLSIGPGTGRKK